MLSPHFLDVAKYTYIHYLRLPPDRVAYVDEPDMFEEISLPIVDAGR